MVAPALLGKKLVHGDQELIIVETEAYVGSHDAAAHSRFGPTKRNAVMFGPAGHAYVFLCYGVHELFNIVTGKEGEGQAVLIRAGAVPGHDHNVARGPGKLSKAMGITRKHGGMDLTAASSTLFVSRGRAVAASTIKTSARIGVDYAGDWAKRKLRFYLASHPAVSGPRRSRQ